MSNVPLRTISFVNSLIQLFVSFFSRVNALSLQFLQEALSSPQVLSECFVMLDS